MAPEKRRSPRVEKQDIVHVRLVPNSTSNSSKKVLNQPLLLKAKNMSQEGICLETEDFFMPDQILRLDFQSVQNEPASAYASVIWSEKTICGLRFIKPGEYLNRLIEKEEKT